MAALRLLAAAAVVLLLSAASSAEAAIAIGGATSVQDYVAQAILSAGSAKPDYGTYANVGSGTGIANFILKTYQVAFSDAALTTTQDGDAGGANKYTIPFTVATYSFCTKKSAALKLTGSQVYNIYSSDSPLPWSNFLAGAGGTVVPVARSDKSGTTEVVGSWIKSKVAAWPATTTASWNTLSSVSKLIQYGAKSDGVLALIKGNANAIGYVQTGLCVTDGVPQAAILNPAGNYIFAAKGADLAALLPNPVPNLSSNYFSGINILNKAGPNTYPIASIVFQFARKSYGNAATSRIVKAWVTYTMGASVQNLGPSFGFDKLPTQYTAAGAAVTIAN